MVTTISLFVNSLVEVLNFSTLIIGSLGALMGVVIGALPGLGPSAGVALLLPVTLKMNSDQALIMIVSLYVGASFGGRISSILANIPGDSAAVATTFDGYPMTLKGEAGVALSISAFSSFIGGMIGIIIAVLSGNVIAGYALKFGPPEYFAVMVFAIGATSILAGKNKIKGIIMTMIGLILAMVGLDYVSGQNRLTYGIIHLELGIDFLVIVMGMFAVGEILRQIYNKTEVVFKQDKFKLKELFPEKSIWKRVNLPILRASFLGFIVGILPGAGATPATFLTYATEKKLAKHPEDWGKGAPEGVSSVEAANNGASVGALLPMLSLGIPGSGTTAVILGALIMWGFKPGPLLVTQHPQMYWGLFAALFLVNIILLIMNIGFIPGFVWILKAAQKYFYAIIGCITIIGVYSINNRISDLIIMMIIGLAAYYLRRASFPVGPLVLSVVLGPKLEASLRQSLIMSNGDFGVFFDRPISGVVLVITFLIWLYILITFFLRSKRKAY